MAKIPVLPLMAGGLAMYALNEREKAKKAEENFCWSTGACC